MQFLSANSHRDRKEKFSVAGGGMRKSGHAGVSRSKADPFSGCYEKPRNYSSLVVANSSQNGSPGVLNLFLQIFRNGRNRWAQQPHQALFPGILCRGF